MRKKVFNMPKPVSIMGRTSSITNAFVNGIIPVIKPMDEEVDEVLETLGMTRDTICCAYCGDSYTEWDHFHPLIKNKKATGYISEIYNLVPSCGKCNQSKGNKEWLDWIYSDVKLSPKTRGVKNLDERVNRLKQFEEKYHVRKYDFEKIVGEKLWEQHWNNWSRIIDDMKVCQITSDIIKKKITQYTHK